MIDKSFTYKGSGVNIEAGYESVKRIKEHVSKTFDKNVLTGLGSFSSLYELPKYNNPVLVAGTDGVGTKLKLAFQTGIHNTIGIDGVAMCVNDIICQGAKPLFFLDYIGTGILEPDITSEVVLGVSEGCIIAECSLVGGETAEMPGLYKKGEYDLAGFAVGVVEKDKIINGENIKEGDILIGIASSGLHSNGFSLVNNILETKKIPLNDKLDGFEKNVGETLLTPTKIYAKLILSLIEKFEIKGISNITGGGWYENIPRMFSDDSLKAVVKKENMPVQDIFKVIVSWGNVEEKEMYNTFNMGMGMTLAVDNNIAEDVVSYINEFGEKAYIIGEVKNKTGDEEGVEFV